MKEDERLEATLNTVREEYHDLVKRYLELPEEDKLKYLSDIPGISDHLDDFFKLKLEPQLWILTSVFNKNYGSFSMLGIEDPNYILNDAFEYLPSFFPNLVEIQRYQRMVYYVLRDNGWIPILRRQALEDFNSPIDTEYGEFGTAWGVLKSYTPKVLENFLTETPNPFWIGINV